MRLTIFGSGYVGLVTGACLAEVGNNVLCVDVDERKVEMLKRGESPIYEPGLDDLLRKNLAAGRLNFTTDAVEGVKHGLFQFIAVGTPPDEDGSADLKYVLAVAETIGKNIGEYRVVVTKSTVPVGTADKVKAKINSTLQARGAQAEFDVVSNPEFLKEGAAINDFMKPDRIVVGTDNPRTAELLKALYDPFTRNRERMIVMDVRSSDRPPASIWPARLACSAWARGASAVRRASNQMDMTSHVLITGGAGFIGSHVADELLRQGLRVRALDSLVPQVHGPDRRRPAYLDPEVELIVGDVRDRDAVRSALRGVDAVCPLRGRGRGRPEHVQDRGVTPRSTTSAPPCCSRSSPTKPVRALLVASSMSVYGEGLYRTASGARWSPAQEPAARAAQARRLGGPSEAGEALVPVPDARVQAAGARVGLRALQVRPGAALPDDRARLPTIPTVALRFFNVYGRRQALSNPYTGVLAIFAARLLNGASAARSSRTACQRRDFVSVHRRRPRLRAGPRAPTPRRARCSTSAAGASYTRAEVAERAREAMGRAASSPRSPGKPGWATSATASPTSALARQHARRTRRASRWRRGSDELADWLEGQVAQDRVAEAARGAGVEGADGERAPRRRPGRRDPGGRTPGADHRRRRLHRRQPGPPPAPGGRARCVLFDNLSRPLGGAQRRVAEAHPRRPRRR